MSKARPQPSATISLRMCFLVVMGVRKNPVTRDTGFSGGLTDQGYTMHSLFRPFGKNLDDFCLININGRIYDHLNRPVISGIYNHKEPATQAQMQDLVDIHNETNQAYAESFSASTPDFGGYTNNCFPELDAANDILHTITYYDNYQCLAYPLIVHPDNPDRIYTFDETQLNFIYHNSEKTKGMVTVTVTTVTGHDGLSTADEWLLSVNHYDKYGNLIQTISDNHLNGYDITSSKYNFTGDLLETKTSHTGHETITLKETYAYDNAQRLVSTTHQVNSQDPVTLHHNTYDELGQLKRKKLHVNSGDGVQQEDYTYNMRGWLLNINDVTSPGDDLFAMKLGYASGDNPQYNGNISSMEWKSSKFGELNSYQFAYDEADRLKDANYQGIGNFRVNIHNYDKNGNIESLSRYGRLGESDQYNMIDALYYSYEGNQLHSVDDYNGNDFQNNGFTDNGSFAENEYFYDANGNLTKDLNKNITDIKYSWNNLPKHILLAQDNQNTIDYLYNATGTKLRKVTSSDQAAGLTTDYTGPFVYEDSKLAFIQTSEGRVVPDQDAYAHEYFLVDHLGNTRVVFNEQGEVLQDNSYYPFGGIMEGLNYTAGLVPENKYLYNGKEMQDDFGLDWYDYGARFYDAQLGRWHVVDPMAESMNSWSPYNYTFNNPLRFIDPSGMVPGDFYDQDGNKIGTDGIDDKQIYIVTNEKEVETISKTNETGGTTQVADVSSAVELPSTYVRAQMGESIDRSNSINESVGDTKGGFHEEGGTYGESNGKDVVVNAKPGQANMELEPGSKVSISTTKPADPKSVPSNYKITGTFHVHPKGHNNGRAFVQTVSKGDYTATKNISAKGADNHFVFGARSGKVYIYKTSGTIATFPLSKFKTIAKD